MVIFVIIFSKCSFHFAFWERITPRCLWLVDKGIPLPLKENSMLSMSPVLEKNKISVFSVLNDISHLLDQAFSSSRSWLITVFILSTLWLEYPSNVSSANNLLNDINCSPISFIFLKTWGDSIPTLGVHQLRQVRNLTKNFY